jgi:hypothetical protein
LEQQGAVPPSEAGSSRLGRLLLSAPLAAASGVFAATDDSQATPPQSSDSSSVSGDFSGFDGTTVVSVEPIIIPITDDVNDRTQVVQTEVNLEKGIAALVALQVANQQEGNQTKEPRVVAEEGLLFMESNADYCCVGGSTNGVGAFIAACLASIAGDRCHAESKTETSDDERTGSKEE